MNENTPVPPVPTDKKGIPVLGWVGIGCGTILIIVIVVVSLMIGWCKRTVGDLSEFSRNPEKASAEMIVRLTPDLKLVSQDEAKGEMTIRTKNGEEITMSYKEVAEGKFMLKDAQGNLAEIGGSDLSKVPTWVPRVPDAKTATAAFHAGEVGKGSGLYSATTAMSAEELGEFFKAEAEKLKANTSSSKSTVVNGVESRTLGFEGAGRKLNIVITSKPATDTQVTVSYEEK